MLADRVAARVNVDPYGELPMANPSSALGSGFALSVKPEFLMPGAREHLTLPSCGTTRDWRSGRRAPRGRPAGLKVAAPPEAGLENRLGYINRTSAAAALASRTAHRIPTMPSKVPTATTLTRLPAARTLDLPSPSPHAQLRRALPLA
jgi:hypothetical protein